MILQQCLGLKPGELMRLEAAHVALPDGTWFGRRKDAGINPGAKLGTKLKRAQAAVFDGVCSPREMRLLQALVQTSPEDATLLRGFDVPRLNRLLARVCLALGLRPYTAHSGRAGFASDAIRYHGIALRIADEHAAKGGEFQCDWAAPHAI